MEKKKFICLMALCVIHSKHFITLCVCHALGKEVFSQFSMSKV